MLISSIQWGCTTGNAAPVAKATFYVQKENKAEKIEGQPLPLFM
jgi:hypothetical protein